MLNQWKTPKGAIRKNNPFGTREMEALNSLKYIEFVGFHNSNWFSRFYVPVYSVVGTKGYFDYYVSGGKINIVG